MSLVGSIFARVVDVRIEKLFSPCPPSFILCRERNGTGMSARLLAPPRIQHNFNESPVCVVDSHLQISHELPGLVDICWGTSAVSAASENVLITGGPHLNNDKQFIWCGQTSGTVSSAVAGHVVSIPVRAVVQQPGWVGLEGCWVTWNCKDFPQLSGAMSISSANVWVGM